MSRPRPFPKPPRSITPSPAPIPPHGSSLPIPSFDFLLDPSIIPSLPPPGGTVTHHELMGRPRAVTSSSNPDAGRMPSLQPERPALVKRSSSFEEKYDSGNRAGVGAGNTTSTGHGRNWSNSTSDTIVQELRPRLLKRTSSFERLKEVQGITAISNALTRTRGVNRSRGKGHSRTWSDSTITRGSAQIPNRSSSATPPLNPVASLESCIKLHNPDADQGKISKLLITLQALIPPSRAPIPGPPQPQTGLLHPETLITPLAIILEALVVEREIFKDTHTSTPPRLPTLRDGSTFQLSGPEGDGELDWRVTKAYIFAVGTILDGIMEVLEGQRQRYEEGEAVAIDGFVRMVRVYVGKMKKVFGEIAGMYVDGYGFLKGWWDDRGMKGAAGEVGRWGEVFNA